MTHGMLLRMVNRYSEDSYYVSTRTLHSGMVVELGDTDGKLLWDTVAKTEADKAHDALTVTFGVIKRGYVPTVIEKSASFDIAVRHIDVSVRLKKVNDYQQNAVMDNLDRLRWEAQSFDMNALAADGAEIKLGGIKNELLELAKQCESEGNLEEASQVYYVVANMPSINVVRSGNGRILSRKYIRGYDYSDSEKYAFMEKAIRFAEKNPEMKLNALGRDYERLKLADPGGSNSDRDVYLVESKKIKDASPDRIWPSYYHLRYRIYVQMNDAPNACKELQGMHELEPDYFSSEQWDFLRGMVDFINKRKGLHPSDPDWVSCQFDNS